MIPAIDYTAMVGKRGTASKLLQAIHEHYLTEYVERKGVTWTPVPRQRLMAITGLSRDQYVRAVRTLRAKRLVFDRMGYYGNSRMPHFRIGGELEIAEDLQLIALADANKESGTATLEQVSQSKIATLRKPRKGPKNGSKGQNRHLVTRGRAS